MEHELAHAVLNLTDVLGPIHALPYLLAGAAGISWTAYLAIASTKARRKSREIREAFQRRCGHYH